MLSSSHVLSVIIVCGVLWVALGIMEYGMKLYNRCKEYAARRQRIINLGHDPEDHGHG